MTSATRTRALLLGAAVLTAVVVPATPATASGCALDFSGAQGEFAYEAPAITEGKNKKVTTVGYGAGSYAARFYLGSPLCPGFTLSVHVGGTDPNAALGWSTTQATAYVGQDYTTKDSLAAPAGTSTTAGAAQVVFSGSGQSQGFVVNGATGEGYGQQCVDSRLVLSGPSGTSATGLQRACAGGGSGGTSFFGVIG